MCAWARAFSMDENGFSCDAETRGQKGAAAWPGFPSAQAIAKLIAAEGVNVKPYRSKAFCRRAPGGAPLVKMAAPGRRGPEPFGASPSRASSRRAIAGA